MSLSFQQKDHAYRDRAAERRTLHGGFGVVPGQKKSADDDSSTAVSDTPEEAAAEALNISFGVGSYAARKDGQKRGKNNWKLHHGFLKNGSSRLCSKSNRSNLKTLL